MSMMPPGHSQMPPIFSGHMPGGPPMGGVPPPMGAMPPNMPPSMPPNMPPNMPPLPFQPLNPAIGMPALPG